MMDFALGTVFGFWLIKVAFPLVLGYTFTEFLMTVWIFY